ncbi:hypothetical protein E4U41_005799 [Claviceps citrina]|nr:hypothetical protein E4U41_005799 [Claviceps citrina]
MMYLSVQEHRGWTQPSNVTSYYLVLTILLELAEARTLCSRLGRAPITALFAASIALKFVMLLLQELPRPPILVTNERYTVNKSAGGLLRGTLSWWSNSLFKKGRRSILTNDHLGHIDAKFDSSTLLSVISATWAACREPPARYDEDVARGLIAATFFVYAGISITRCFYKHLISQLMTMIRGALVGLIYQKTLNLQTSSVADPASVTLMSTDADGVMSAAQALYDLWPGVVELGAGLVLLDREAGHSSFLVLVPGVLCWLVSRKVSMTMLPVQRDWNEAIQARVSATSSVLGQIKGIKMLGLSDYMSQIISGFRMVELGKSQKSRTVIAWVTSFSAAVNSLSPIVVIVAAVLTAKSLHDLAASKMFTTLSIVILVSQPISNLVGSYAVLMSGLACCRRIQSFLLIKDKADYREFIAEPEAPLPSRSKRYHHASEPGLELSALSGPTRDMSSVVVHVRQANFITSDQRTELLYNIDLQLSAGSVSIVVGPVGCGKSSLLRGILGELHLLSGAVQLATSSVAYCDQDPWLRNVSLRENILGTSPFDQEWYDQVVVACSLERDIAFLPCRDKTLAGSGGMALSGGQRRRVGLARAVYSRHALVLLDDVLSGLDSTTSAFIFNSLLGDDGLLRRRNATVLLATHSIQFLHRADFVTLLESGRIKYNQVKCDAAGKEIRHTIRMHVKNACLDAQSDVGSQDELGEMSLHRATGGSPAGLDLARRSGDLSLYLFYLGSIGRVFTLALLFLAISFSVLKKMPQIWLRIWTERGIDRNKRDFLRVYLTIAVVYLASIWILCRSSRNLHKLLLEVVMK